MSKERAISRPAQYKSLQAGRGIAALMVVVAHIGFVLETHADAFAGSRLSLQAIHTLRLQLSGGAMGVEFFFVLSGVVILLAHARDIGQPGALRRYAWKRFRRIYPFYWIVLPVWLALYLSLSTQHDPMMTLPATLFSNVILVHVGNMTYDLIVAWTLFHEILFYAVFALSILNRRLGQVAVAAWILGSVTSFLPHTPGWLSEYFFSPLHLLFVWGMLIALRARARPIRLPMAWFSVGLTLFFVAMALCATYTEWNEWVRQLAGAGAALTVLGALQLERDGRLRIPLWLSFLGDASYAIYLVHVLALVIAIRPAILLWNRFHVALFVCMLPMFLFAVLSGCLVHRWVERPLLRWLGALGNPVFADHAQISTPHA